MDRPYMICHILSALDGKISGEFMGTEAAQSAGAEYGRIRLQYLKNQNFLLLLYRWSSVLEM